LDLRGAVILAKWASSRRLIITGAAAYIGSHTCSSRSH
jgi:hypothetical protein